MAFGLKRTDLLQWKREVANGDIAFLTHYWQDPRFPGATTVTKVGCCDIERLAAWGRQYGLKPEWIDHKEYYPHFDLFGYRQKDILQQEKQWEQLQRFRL